MGRLLIASVGSSSNGGTEFVEVVRAGTSAGSIGLCTFAVGSFLVVVGGKFPNLVRGVVKTSRLIFKILRSNR